MLKRLIFPLTPLVVITVLSVIITTWALFIVFTSEPSAGLLGGIAVGITQIVIILYLADRILVKKLAYKKIVFGELALGIIIAFCFSYQESTIDINIQTDKDYVLVFYQVWF